MSGALLQMSLPGVSNRHFLIENGGTNPYLKKWNKTTNFATETLRQDFATEPAFGRTCTVTIGRQGDLLAGLVLEVTMTSKDNYFPRATGAYHPVEALVKNVWLNIGGNEIERITPDWLRIYDSFMRSPCCSSSYRAMTNFDAPTLNTTTKATETFQLPLPFTLCRHRECALPLVALRDHEVKLIFEFATAEEVGVEPDNFSATVFADYVYLDQAERVALVAKPLEYLIEQVQYNEFVLPDYIPNADNVSTYDALLKMYRPVKALFWCVRNDTPPTEDRTHHGRYVGDAANTYLSYQPNPFDMSGYGLIHCVSERLAPLAGATLMLDGQTRFHERSGDYFEKVQAFQHFPRTTFPGMYAFSFALRPADLQPSGTCNFSAVDRVTLRLRFKKNVTDPVESVAFEGDNARTTARNIDECRTLLVFGLNYNVLRIQGGRAGLVF